MPPNHALDPLCHAAAAKRMLRALALEPLQDRLSRGDLMNFLYAMGQVGGTAMRAHAVITSPDGVGIIKQWLCQTLLSCQRLMLLYMVHHCNIMSLITPDGGVD